MTWTLQYKSIDGHHWWDVAEFETREDAVQESIERALDPANTGNDRTGSAPDEYRVLDPEGKLDSMAPPRPDVEERWRRRHG